MFGIINNSAVHSPIVLKFGIGCTVCRGWSRERIAERAAQERGHGKLGAYPRPNEQLYASLFRQKQAAKNKQTRKKQAKNKYIAKESNTVPHAYGNRHD